MRELAGEFTEEITNLDGKVLRTFRTLLLRPGQLTLDYFAGRRARYVSPVRLYFLCSLFYFIAVPFAESLAGNGDDGGGKALVASDAPEARGKDVADSIPKALSGIKGLRIDTAQHGSRFRITQSDSGAAQGAIERWLERKGPEWNRRFENGDYKAAFREMIPRVVFALVPFAAFCLMLVYRSRRLHYPRHLYVAVHLHAAFFLLLAVRALVGLIPGVGSSGWVSLFISTYLLWYFLAAQRRVYGGSWKGAFARLSLVSLPYSLVLAAGFAVALLLAVTLG